MYYYKYKLVIKELVIQQFDIQIDRIVRTWMNKNK